MRRSGAMVLAVVIVFSAALMAADAPQDRKGAIKITEGKTVSVPITNAKVAPKSAAATAAAVIRPLSDFMKEASAEDKMLQIDIEEAMMLYKSGKALFIDSRGFYEYEQEHIKGSISIPSSEAEKQIEANKDLLKDKILVTYCHGAGCHMADKSAKALYKAGFKRTAVFFGGWPKWKGVNGETEGKIAPPPVPTTASK